MYGYVTINKPEIKFKDYDVYRAYYCGLCRSLGRKYGPLGRMTLGNDMTFLVLLLSGLYDTDTGETVRRCVAHPLKKHRERRNEFTDYAADMNLLLFYEKCMDDWRDERKLSRRIYAAMISSRVKGVRQRYPKKAEVILSCLRQLSQMEAGGECSIDGVSGIFGTLLAEIFAYRQDVWESTLRQIGFYLGKFIYLMDAYDDVEDDIKNGNFNPLASLYGEGDFDQRCGSILKMMISACTDAFERLPVDDNMEILRNILYAGVWSQFEITLQKRKEKENV